MAKKRLGDDLPRYVWRSVTNPRYSFTGCGTPLSDLDWGDWWPDGWEFGKAWKNSPASFYLHVAHKNKVDGTRHRVYCRHAECPRLGMRDGKLMWIFESKG